MQSKWSDREAARFVERYGADWGEDLALRIYLAGLIGSEEDLVLHGGGNTSVKTVFRNILGDRVPVLYVKASGLNMAAIEPEGYIRLDLEHLRRLRSLERLSEDEMLEILFGMTGFKDEYHGSLSFLKHLLECPD